MKSSINRSVLFFASILLLIVIFPACNATRFLAEDQALVTKVRIDSVDKEFSETAYNYVQNDVRPNSRINLALYNTFNTKNGAYRTDRIRNIGEAPHILDSSLVEISRNQIEKFLGTKGYFDARVKSDVQIKNKRATVVYTAKQGPLFKVRNITYKIEDSTVAALYLQNKKDFTRIKTGQRFDADSLTWEREQIFRLMKRNGYFDYFRQYVRFRVDSNLNASLADVELTLANPEGKTAHPIYTITNGTITVRKSNGELDSLLRDTAVIDSQHRFVDHSRRFRPAPIGRYVFLKKGETYSSDKEDLTYDRLYELNVFRNIKIDYAKTSDSTNRLRPRIDIVPLKRMSNRIEGEYTFNSGRNGFNIGNTYTNRNIFGGAELLELKARYGILFDTQVQSSLLDKIFSRDLQLGANLVWPRLLTPFPIPVMGKNGIPRTTVSTSLQFFDQRASFSSRVFINSITYDWIETRYKAHTLTPINLEFRNGQFNEAFQDSLVLRGYGVYVVTNGRRFLNLGSQYAYTLNNLKLPTFGNFVFFRGAVDMAGNTLGLLSTVVNFKKDPEGFKKVFTLPYQQYVKTELDIRIYRSLGGERQFVARFNPGLGLAYGNSRNLTFEKNFFAGGVSGVRAWQARTLGPGNYSRASIGTGGQADTIRSLLRNLDQLGEIKFEGNLEYRFKLADNLFNAKVKGAAFVDYGNIWRRRPETINPGGEIDFSRLWQQVAVGAGFGLRFDLNYFVFRLDAGVKVKDPQFSGSDQYVIKHLFNAKEFKDRYDVTHRPDIYRLVQYNFGIGMPF